MRNPLVGAGLLLAGLAQADAIAAAPEEVIVTGTRQPGIAFDDSPVPVERVDNAALARFSSAGLAQDLAGEVPSFEAQGWGSGVGNNSLSARLRGLSPNETLVLINGKRRHGSANFQVLGGIYGGPFQGGAAPDLGFIPVSAIDHVEVLTDDAAAQYGSDAIAGVINIILKDERQGGRLAAEGGQYEDQGGRTADASVVLSFPFGANGFLDLAAETRYHAHSNRGAIDPRLGNSGSAAAIPFYPRVNKIEGDAASHLETMSWNGAQELSGEWEFYSFGTLGRKYAASYENWRTPAKLPALYPQGFSPEETLSETDAAATAGARGRLFGWKIDLGATYGYDHGDLFNIDSANVSLFQKTGSTPTRMQTGAVTGAQWTANLDLSRRLALGRFGQFDISWGGEARRDSYRLFPGDYASRYAEGSQANPGFSLTDAGGHGRDAVAAYLDLAWAPVEALLIDVAGRLEHYEDFGAAKVGKVTARYELVPGLALRGAFGSGFRAPTLVEEYYSATNVSPTSASAQLAPDSRAASLLGIRPLRPELSRDLSAGVTGNLGSDWQASADFYSVAVDRRVLGSGTVFGLGSPSGPAYNSAAVLQAIAANGNVLDSSVRQTGITIFSNGADTLTRGMDAKLSHRLRLGEWGSLDWSFAAAVTDTKVRRVLQTPTQILPQRLYDLSALSAVEDETPKYRLILGGVWSWSEWRISLRETLYGPTSNQLLGDNNIWYRNEIHAHAVTDLSIAYDLPAGITLELGANNLLNEYPDKLNPGLLRSFRKAGDVSAVLQYPSFSPFGFDGGYYYGRVSYRF